VHYCWIDPKSRLAAVHSAFGFADCVYFYVAHACHWYGNAVFVYESTALQEWQGNATPFDTGAVFYGAIRCDVEERNLGYGDKGYIAVQTERIAILPDRLVPYVENFASIGSYVTGEGPTTPVGRSLIGVGHQGTPRAPWIWEVRVEHNIPILPYLRRVYLMIDDLIFLKKLITSVTLSPGDQHLEFHSLCTGVITSDMNTVCTQVERDIAEVYK